MQAVTDIGGLLVQKFSFGTGIAGDQFSCFGYNYLSIVPDGVINPLVNFPSATQALETDFYIEFRDKTKLMINGPVENLPIWGREKFKLWYTAYSAENATVQGGYGSFYLILSRTMIPAFKHHIEPPRVCKLVAIAGGTLNDYWLGVGRPDAGYELLVPYVPEGYHTIGYYYWTDSPNHFFKLTEYPCFDDQSKLVIDIVASGEGSSDIYGGGRFRLQVRNSDGSQRSFKFWLVFRNRSIA